MWQGPRGGSHELDHIPGLPDLNPIALVRRALSSCPDEFPSASTAGLDFIGEADLRESLRMDLSAGNQALANGEWKAATVLGGSLIEALLLWRLQKCEGGKVTQSSTRLFNSRKLKKKPANDLTRWDLSHYIEVAADLEVITEETAIQARLAKDYRNLIHPGRSERLKQKCDRATALSAVAAVEHLIRDLTDRGSPH
jgi:hypothetical protein